MKKQHFFFLLLPSLFINITLANTKTKYTKLFVNEHITENEFPKNSMYEHACLGNTKKLINVFNNSGIEQLLKQNPKINRNILHYLAIFNQNETLYQIINITRDYFRYIFHTIATKDSQKLSPMQYAIQNKNPYFETIFKALFTAMYEINNHIKNSPEKNSSYNDNIDENESDDDIKDKDYIPDIYNKDDDSYENYCLEIKKKSKIKQKYNCPHCDKNYPTGCSLGKHMKKKHNIKRPKKLLKYSKYLNQNTNRYNCPYCDKNYSVGQTLGLHMEQKHNIKRAKHNRNK